MNKISVYMQKHIVIDAMRTYGGSFVKAMAEMLAHADLNNTYLIYTTWPDIWNKYLNFEKRLDENE